MISSTLTDQATRRYRKRAEVRPAAYETCCIMYFEIGNEVAGESWHDAHREEIPRPGTVVPTGSQHARLSHVIVGPSRNADLRPRRSRFCRPFRSFVVDFASGVARPFV